MIKKILISFIFIYLIFIAKSDFLLANGNDEYYKQMNNWDEKISLASKYLIEAEKSLKEGDAIEGCIKQKKAAEYGIIATNSLIKAFKLSGSTEDFTNLESGLNKWKELRDFC